MMSIEMTETIVPISLPHPIPGTILNRESYAMPAMMSSKKYGKDQAPTKPKGKAKYHQPREIQKVMRRSRMILRRIFLFMLFRIHQHPPELIYIDRRCEEDLLEWLRRIGYDGSDDAERSIAERRSEHDVAFRDLHVARKLG